MKQYQNPFPQNPKERLIEAKEDLGLSAMGINIGVAIFMGCLIGYWIDGLFETGPWGFLVFMVFGIIAGFLNIFRELQRLQERERAEERRQTTHPTHDDQPGA